MHVEKNQTYFYVMHFMSLPRLYSTECLVNNELKGCGRKWPWPNFRYIYISICLEGQKKTIQNQCPETDTSRLYDLAGPVQVGIWYTCGQLYTPTHWNLIDHSTTNSIVCVTIITFCHHHLNALSLLQENILHIF